MNNFLLNPHANMNNLNTTNHPKQYSEQVDPSKEISYSPVLGLPIYTSTIKTDWFKIGTDNIWYYLQTNANGISKQHALFDLEIFLVTTIDPDQWDRFKYLIIQYNSFGKPKSTVIPYEKFIKKNLQEFFFLPVGFRIPNSKDNVINEFLYFLILNCKNHLQDIHTYPHQGWNQDSNNNLVFESKDRYDKIFFSYLCQSTLKRSNEYCYAYDDNYPRLPKIKEIISDNWKIKFLMALRITSLLQYFLFKSKIKNEQLFVFETTNTPILELISTILKTNNEYDNEILDLYMPTEKLLNRISEVSDGIAVIYDNSSIDNAKKLSDAVCSISNHILNNNFVADGSKQIIAIISQYAQYDIYPEQMVTLSIDMSNHGFVISEIKRLLQEIDCLVISSLLNKEFQKEVALTIEYHKGIMPESVPYERKDLYCAMMTSISVYNHITANLAERLSIYEISKDFFTEKDKNEFKNIIVTIDRTGQSQTNQIINNFAKALNKCILKIYNTIPLSKCIIDEVNNNTILIDEEHIYLDTSSIDNIIIPNMDFPIKHRQLIRILYDCNLLSCMDHFCYRISYFDASGNRYQEYRYAIKKSMLNEDSLSKIRSATNGDFFVENTNIPRNGFLPFIFDPNTNQYVGRLIESGIKANNHILITGESGSGKSALMIRTAAFLADMGKKVIMLDSSDSNTYEELKNILPEEYIDRNIKVIDLENQKFIVDPFSLDELKRKDSKANAISEILLSAVYDASNAQSDKLKTLILENIDSLEQDGRIPPQNIINILKKDGSTISSLRDKLYPILVYLTDNITYENTWADLLESSPNIIVFSLNAQLDKQGKKLFDILLASLYKYHSKHRYSELWLCIDEICDHNLREESVINKIFTQGRKNKINIIGATQKFELSKSEEWDTLNNAKTKIFFKPLSSSFNDVMKELNMSQSERYILSNMTERECILSSELYSTKTKSNQPAVVQGKVPDLYTSISTIISQKIIPQQKTIPNPTIDEIVEDARKYADEKNSL